MINKPLVLKLPFTPEDDGFPSLQSVRDSGYSCFAIVVELDDHVYGKLGKLLADERSLLHLSFYNDSLDNFGRLLIGKDSIEHHLEELSVFNVLLSDRSESRHAFLSGDGRWIVFMGNGDFVEACRAEFEHDVEALATRTAEELLYSEPARLAAIEFVRNYSGHAGAAQES